MVQEDKSLIILWIDKTLDAIKGVDSVLRGSTAVLYEGEDGLKKKDELQRMRSQMYLSFFNYCKEKDIWKYYVEYKNKTTLDFIKKDFHQDPSGVFINFYGDEYSYDPLTGLLEQTAWGL